MEQLAKQSAEMALRLAAIPRNGQPDPADLNALEELAWEILQQVSAARLREPRYETGEMRGAWPAYAAGKRYGT